LVIVKPETLIRWHRHGFRLFWRRKSRRPGRPPISSDVQRLIATMAAARRTWGQEPIANEFLLKLGIRLSPRTVRRYMRSRRGITGYISLGHEVAPSKPPNPAHLATPHMAARLASDTGRTRYRRRKAIVEPVLGWIKEALGFRRFMMRGLAKARDECNVVCLAVNLKRLHRIQLV